MIGGEAYMDKPKYALEYVPTDEDLSKGTARGASHMPKGRLHPGPQKNAL